MTSNVSSLLRMTSNVSSLLRHNCRLFDNGILYHSCVSPWSQNKIPIYNIECSCINKLAVPFVPKKFGQVPLKSTCHTSMYLFSFFFKQWVMCAKYENTILQKIPEFSILIKELFPSLNKFIPSFTELPSSALSAYKIWDSVLSFFSPKNCQIRKFVRLICNTDFPKACHTACLTTILAPKNLAKAIWIWLIKIFRL